MERQEPWLMANPAKNAAILITVNGGNAGALWKEKAVKS